MEKLVEFYGGNEGIFAVFDLQNGYFEVRKRVEGEWVVKYIESTFLIAHVRLLGLRGKGIGITR